MNPDAAPPTGNGFQRLVTVLLSVFVSSILAGVVAVGVLAAAFEQWRAVVDRPPPAIRLGGAWTASSLSPADSR